VTNIAPKKKKRRRGCSGCIGCLGLLLLLVFACAVTLFLGPALLRAADLIPPAPEVLYGGAPDPEQSREVQESLEDVGIEGARAHVIPVRGRNQSLTVVTFGANAKFADANDVSGDSIFIRSIERLAEVNARGLNVTRTVASFEDDNGDPLIAVTVAQEAMEAFANGTIDRNEFLSRVDADLSNILDINRIESLVQRNQSVEREEELALVAELAAEWAVGKNIVTTDCEPPFEDSSCSFGVNPLELARWRAGQNEVLGYGMDLIGANMVEQEASSALKAARVVNDLTRAENLAEEGLKQRNLSKIEEAVALRPNDWGMRDRRAAYMLAEGNEEEANRALSEAEELVEDQINRGGDCKALQLNLLRNRRSAFSSAAEVNPGSRSLQDQLARTREQIQAIESDQEGGPCT